MENTEIYVRDVVRDSADELVVVAVPNSGISVKVGDVFRVKYEIERTLDDIVHGMPPNQTRLNVAEIDLVVEKIDVMRQSVEQLPPGMTGGLYLSGSGFFYVMPKYFLRTGTA